ncbi:MAG: carboxy terminal-processing peptidase [Herminiimonas sp.]|nr:carboxy terminal-processing peptidase [Herminiimonas sp.]
MKMKLLALLILIGGSTHAATSEAVAAPTLLPLVQQAQAAKISAEILTRNHYKKVPLDDALSQKIFDRYLKDMDGEKLFFTQADVDAFSVARNKLDDAIYGDDLKAPFTMFNHYQRRVVERFTYSGELLKKGFDFSDKETYQIDREKAAWPASVAELQDLWRKRVKGDWLRLKLAGSDDKAIRATLGKRYDKALSRAAKVKSDDVFQLFMNAYTMSIEPHTNYLGPKASEEFDISMRLSLFGIGAVLSENEEYTTIRELVAGGPAALSNKLKVGDRIVRVGEGAGGTMTDVVGWRINDVVELIRGNKGSQVVLEILPATAGVDGKQERVSLVRDKINVSQQAAKKSIIQTKNGGVTRQVGVISLPVFYLDFDARTRGDTDFKSATRDVAKLLEELKKDNVDSVLIDLRNNGGGALTEAVELTGLFIGKGPVVQQRNSQGAIRIEAAENAAPAWTKPVGVLINRGSASASEIFAAAIQDYGRGVVIGETSFGKGTVQTLVNLDKLIKSDKPRFGELKMTVAQFFRVNGGTTQLRGVVPDISLPSTTDRDEFGESSYGNALPWAQIPAITYRPAGDLTELLPMLKIRHDTRIGQDKEFAYLLEDIAEVQAKRKGNVISLNEAVRRKERDTQDARTKLREAGKENAAAEKSSAKAGDKAERSATARAALKLQQDDGLQANERNVTANLAAEKARKDEKDIYLNEAAEILGDEVELLKSNVRLASRVQPGVASEVRQKAN